MRSRRRSSHSCLRVPRPALERACISSRQRSINHRRGAEADVEPCAFPPPPPLQMAVVVAAAALPRLGARAWVSSSVVWLACAPGCRTSVRCARVPPSTRIVASAALCDYSRRALRHATRFVLCAGKAAPSCRPHPSPVDRDPPFNAISATSTTALNASPPSLPAQPNRTRRLRPGHRRRLSSSPPHPVFPRCSHQCNPPAPARLRPFAGRALFVSLSRSIGAARTLFRPVFALPLPFLPFRARLSVSPACTCTIIKSTARAPVPHHHHHHPLIIRSLYPPPHAVVVHCTTSPTTRSLPRPSCSPRPDSGSAPLVLLLR